MKISNIFHIVSTSIFVKVDSISLFLVVDCHLLIESGLYYDKWVILLLCPKLRNVNRIDRMRSGQMIGRVKRIFKNNYRSPITESCAQQMKLNELGKITSNNRLHYDWKGDWSFKPKLFGGFNFISFRCCCCCFSTVLFISTYKMLAIGMRNSMQKYFGMNYIESKYLNSTSVSVDRLYMFKWGWIMWCVYILLDFLHNIGANNAFCFFFSLSPLPLYLSLCSSACLSLLKRPHEMLSRQRVIILLLQHLHIVYKHIVPGARKYFQMDEY